MFPPKKQQGPPMGGPPMGGPPMGPPMGGPPPMGMPPQLPPGMPPGIPKPGQGMDPMMAMLGGLPDMFGASAPPPPMPPPGAPMDGMFPVGGSLPMQDGDAGDGGSALIAALMAGSSDPYAGPPDGTEDLHTSGTGDPNAGLQQLLQLLALGQMGVSGGVQPGGSGVGFDPGMPGAGLI